MWPPGVVLLPPLLNRDLCFLERVKDFSIQTFIPQLAVEAFTAPVLPGAAWLDIQWPRPQAGQPFPQLVGNEFSAIIRSNVLRDSPPQHHLRQRLDHVPTVPSPRHPQRQTFPRVLVDQRQNPQQPSLVRPGTDARTSRRDQPRSRLRSPPPSWNRTSLTKSRSREPRSRGRTPTLTR